jgi:hypothetical protein
LKTFLLFLLLLAMFVAGVLASPKIATTNIAQIDWRSLGKEIDYWASRYQTFLGVLVAIGVASFTISAMSRQTSISERQLLSGQIQALLGDQANLQYVIAELNQSKTQKVLFENNISFLDTAGDQTSGWQNGGNLIRTAFGNIENFRSLVSANTAKFVGPTEARTALISKLDSIVESQDELRASFLNWANLNRNANAELGAPPTPQQTAYLQAKGKVIGLLGELIPLSSAVVVELNKKANQTVKDIADLRKVIDSKQND